MSDPPLILDVDGTLTRRDGWGIDPRVFDPLLAWDGPVVIATGKSAPYPVALCQFLGIPERVVAENGGVVYTGETMTITADAEAARAVAAAYREAGYDLGWEGADTINRWRETEIAVARDQPLAPLAAIADEHGLEVVDTGYAYHVKDPETSKGAGVRTIASHLEFDLDAAVAVGDSENDVSTFGAVGRSFAVGNADAAAREAADVVLPDAHAEGTLSVLEQVTGDGN
ncbi:HAD-IIB family hydrolase [Halobacteria archaeon AArc-dxtr1]|nr:HAD-IIB family hydrolase [Halobacteria archaeon AArc-dxtr1]